MQVSNFSSNLGIQFLRQAFTRHSITILYLFYLLLTPKKSKIKSVGSCSQIRISFNSFAVSFRKTDEQFFVSFISVCNKQFDLTIVMENSAQVGEEQFDEMKDFAKQFVAAFDVREGGTHVAVVSYGSRPVVEVRLNSYSGPVLNTRTITDDIDEIAFRSVSPVSTSSALTEVINTVYGDGNGARNGTNKVTDNFFFSLLKIFPCISFSVGGYTLLPNCPL